MTFTQSEKDIIIVTNKWFENNYDPELVYGQPSEDKILKNLKQFYENKKYKKDRL